MKLAGKVAVDDPLGRVKLEEAVVGKDDVATPLT